METGGHDICVVDLVTPTKRLLGVEFRCVGSSAHSRTFILEHCIYIVDVHRASVRRVGKRAQDVKLWPTRIVVAQRGLLHCSIQ